MGNNEKLVRDIENIDDIKFLVDTFYGKVQQNELIGSIFNGVIGDKWPAHLDKMYRFWQTILLEEVAYSGSPFMAHAPLPLHKEHFDTWMKLWTETIDANYAGSKSDEAKWRAEKMGEMFLYKLDYYRNNPAKPLM